jgi:CHAT domain-containing protein
MTHFYEELQAGIERSSFAEPAAALRAAQLALKEGYSHPYYWAPFVLIGQ